MKRDVRIEVLETPRLILRPYRPDDADALTALLQDPEIHRWTSAIPFPYTIEHARAFIEKQTAEGASGESFVWAITNRANDDVVGAMGLHNVSYDRGSAELGYWIGEAVRGLGYTTEAARRVLSWSFEVAEFHRIQATYLPGNPASGRVMQKCGMREEGLLRGYGLKNGEHIDLYLYAVLRGDADWISTEDQFAR